MSMRDRDVPTAVNTLRLIPPLSARGSRACAQSALIAQLTKRDVLGCYRSLVTGLARALLGRFSTRHCCRPSLRAAAGKQA